jgi:hypothetical protein
MMENARRKEFSPSRQSYRQMQLDIPMAAKLTPGKYRNDAGT